VLFYGKISASESVKATVDPVKPWFKSWVQAKKFEDFEDEGEARNTIRFADMDSSAGQGLSNLA
jgi:hypothetical protein